jgi:hypothetical protein
MLTCVTQAEIYYSSDMLNVRANMSTAMVIKPVGERVTCERDHRGEQRASVIRYRHSCRPKQLTFRAVDAGERAEPHAVL